MCMQNDLKMKIKKKKTFIISPQANYSIVPEK